MEAKGTFTIISLGCFRNTYDSEILAYDFIKRGYKLKKESDDVDILIINTCGFIKEAKEESIEAIRYALKLKRIGKVRKVYVRGCLVERYRDQLERYFPDVDLWEGVLPFSMRFVLRKILVPSHISFLKICEGCSNNCSFCAIPLIKGPLKSKPPESIIEEVKYLDRKGIKELNIIGQDITSWGKDLNPAKDLTFLLRSILKNTKIPWIRLIYTHPRHFSDSLIDIIASEDRICKYIDLPIQHINDRILKLMGRYLSKKEIIELIRKIRRKIPQVVIRTSLIVGFPSETDREFKELLEFVKEMRFERLGVFIYSREEGTPAYRFKPQVHHKIKEKRFREIMTLQKDISYKINQRFLGKTMKVLVDDREKDVFVARTEFDCYEVDGIVYIKRKKLKVGDFYKVKIVDAYEYDLIGE